MARATKRRQSAVAPERPETLADLLRRLGNVPASRVRLHPPTGTATEGDLIRYNEGLFRTALCELVEGTFVEKSAGWEESAITGLIACPLVDFARQRRLGTILGPDGMLRLGPGLIRLPDVSFIARGKLERHKHGGEPVPSIGPDLAVEVISEDDTRAEIARKLVEYFAAGTRLAWVVDPKTGTVRVYQEPRKFILLRAGDVLDGGDVIPGLRIPVKDIFELEDE
jgi:Uma2 family endonuclease